MVIDFITRSLSQTRVRFERELRNEVAGMHSASSRGSYRILYRIDDGARTVTVLPSTTEAPFPEPLSAADGAAESCYQPAAVAS